MWKVNAAINANRGFSTCVKRILTGALDAFVLIGPVVVYPVILVSSRYIFHLWKKVLKYLTNRQNSV